MATHAELNPPPRLLLGPGPSNAHPRVLRAMATPLLGHLDPEFLQIMNRTQDRLRQVFRTRNELTIPVSGTGSAGMETCVVNLIEPGDQMIVCVKGFFGQRMVEVARRAGANVTVLERPWGEVFDINQIAEELRKIRPKVLGIVHAETSTGAWQPISELAAVCRQTETLLLVDAVTSLGGVPLEVDQWGIDAVYSCSQKCLSCPSGLAPVSFGSRAMGVINRRKTKVQSWYLDMSLVQRYWGEERFYHHTTPISMIYALHEALPLILEEGLEARWARHQLNHRALKVGLAAMNITYAATEGHQLPTLNAVRIPEGVDDLAVRKQMLNDFGIEIGGGLGDFKGKVWRIGLMGFNSNPNSVLLFLSALEQCLMKQGIKVNAGAGVHAANEIYTATK
jgi:alanine-glyoxylate transaminase / serine-glyoxylate transaminase / serine-pyruvate transaminase